MGWNETTAQQENYSTEYIDYKKFKINHLN